MKLIRAVIMLDWDLAMIREGPELNGVAVGISQYVQLLLELFPDILQHVELPLELGVEKEEAIEGESIGAGQELPAEVLLLASAAHDLGWNIAVVNPDEEDNVRGLLIGHGEVLDRILESLPEDFITKLNARIDGDF